MGVGIVPLDDIFRVDGGGGLHSAFEFLPIITFASLILGALVKLKGLPIRSGPAIYPAPLILVGPTPKPTGGKGAPSYSETPQNN